MLVLGEKKVLFWLVMVLQFVPVMCQTLLKTALVAVVKMCWLFPSVGDCACGILWPRVHRATLVSWVSKQVHGVLWSHQVRSKAHLNYR